MSLPEQVLECQNCGEVIQVLTPAEAMRVAVHPYNYVSYCTVCERDMLREAIRKSQPRNVTSGATPTRGRRWWEDFE